MRFFLHQFPVLFLFCISVFGQNPFAIKHIEPRHWWLGLKNNQLQLLIHGKDLASCKVSVSGKGWQLRKIHSTANANYLFLDLEILSTALPGKYPIQLSDEKRIQTIDYELKANKEIAQGGQGYGPEDVLYLIMPDRFSNGNPANDFPAGSLEKPDRNNPSGRHGGDLAGIEKHLDYFENLGVSTLWLNPVLENNQEKYSYHGYAITDYYGIDTRFGNLEDYKRLIRLCHSKKLKMVQDMVANHIGSRHWWMSDMPDSNWVHPRGTKCNFRIETILDPHAAPADRQKMLNGWFDDHMPDLNQQHPLLATYLIQNSLWWIAEAGIDGIRMDTYPYNDPAFMTRYCQEILREFPRFSIVGEVWLETPSHAAYFMEGAMNQDGFKGGLPTLTDFPLYFGLTRGLMETGSWDKGLVKIYGALAQDFLYKNPANHLIFLDNHDLTRFYTAIKEDFNKFKQGLGMLLTLRGVPQLYYGGEFLMTGDGASHPEVRKDFPGGWAGDSLNYFEAKYRKGRSDSAFQWVQKLLRWRKTSQAVAKGNFVHYVPEDNMYVYFRNHGKETIMVVVNGNGQKKILKTERYKSQMRGMAMAKEILSGQTLSWQADQWELPPNSIWIMQAEKP